MSHSRILQIHYEPIEDYDRITEELFFDNGFLDSVGDYVSDNTDEESDIKDLLSSFPEDYIKYNDKDKTIIFKEGFKKAYFKPEYEKFKSIVSQFDLELFSGVTSYSEDKKACIYTLKNSIENVFGTYIYEDYYMCLKEFLRELDEGKTYYFGATIGYHW